MSAVDAGYVVAVDQGTSSTKAIAVRGDGQIAHRVTVPVRQWYPWPGWVEHNPEELFDSVVTALTEVAAGLDAPVVVVGISAQRESAVLWDHSDRRALGPVISWQDRRTADRAARLRSSRDRIRELSGLPVDPMFSALKIGWLLDAIGVRRPGMTAGTVDVWLIARLTGDRRIEVGNASRTQLLNVETATWDPDYWRLSTWPRPSSPRSRPLTTRRPRSPASPASTGSEWSAKRASRRRGE
jgi:glycerol kinase